MNNFEEARAAMLGIMLSMQGAGLISDFEEIITTKNMIKLKIQLKHLQKLVKVLALLNILISMSIFFIKC